MKATIRIVLGGVLLLGCGGEVAGSGSDGGSGPDGGALGRDAGYGLDAQSGVDSPVVQLEASTTFDGNVGVTCVQGPSSGLSMGSTCQMSAVEMCSDGTTYSVTCNCPSATCSCSEMSANMGGSSGGGMAYTGCPDCSDVSNANAAWVACGFPH
ncbi:MAG TPA: hypothetical protein VGL81_14120 [Polyangiaceae bacterium]|jgi:hypothetical protein